jgi:hypothetical protein
MAKPKIEGWISEPFEGDTLADRWQYFKYCHRKHPFRTFKYNLTVICKRVWWWFWYTQLFHCCGDRGGRWAGGGWRTGFCDWLEEKARAAEEREEKERIRS